MSRESDLTQLWLKWVESELSQVSKFGFWVESELSQVSKFGIWVESELSHLDYHMSQSRVSPKKMSRAQPWCRRIGETLEITLVMTLNRCDTEPEFGAIIHPDSRWNSGAVHWPWSQSFYLTQNKKFPTQSQTPNLSQLTQLRPPFPNTVWIAIKWRHTEVARWALGLQNLTLGLQVWPQKYT